jgi:hypothetical protein
MQDNHRADPQLRTIEISKLPTVAGGVADPPIHGAPNTRSCPPAPPAASHPPLSPWFGPFRSLQAPPFPDHRLPSCGFSGGVSGHGFPPGLLPL